MEALVRRIEKPTILLLLPLNCLGSAPAALFSPMSASTHLERSRYVRRASRCVLMGGMPLKRLQVMTQYVLGAFSVHRFLHFVISDRCAHQVAAPSTF